MKIKIIQIVSPFTKHVLCKSEFGTFEASWNGELPVKGEWYHVELDVEGIIEVNELCPYILSSDKGITILQGKVDQVFSDTLLIVRLGHYIVQVESMIPNLTIGSCVKIRCETIIATSYTM